MAGAVHIISTDGKVGRAGFTAIAVASISDNPPQILVCMNANNRTTPLLIENGAFCINTLQADEESLAEAFAGRSLDSDRRFDLAEWTQLATGSPVLKRSVVSFDCKIIEARQIATHYVVIGEVVGIQINNMKSALLYWARNYQSLK